MIHLANTIFALSIIPVCIILERAYICISSELFIHIFVLHDYFC